MADIPARTELPLAGSTIGVTTGPIRGSRKVFVGERRVAMRAVDLEPSSGEPPVTLYDTSGPYTDPEATIDIAAGLPPLRREWQLELLQLAGKIRVELRFHPLELLVMPHPVRLMLACSLAFRETDYLQEFTVACQ